ncbi:hypothetical protein ACFLS4_03250 [Bacteroidota bacterium]
MANINDSDILITQTNDFIFLDLECGYGQPSTTTIYLKKNDHTTEKLHSFDNNTSKLKVGSNANLKYNAIEVHTTIHDVNDNPSEMTDISLKVKVYESDSILVKTEFTRKTTGKGDIFHSFYLITIL